MALGGTATQAFNQLFDQVTAGTYQLFEASFDGAVSPGASVSMFISPVFETFIDNICIQLVSVSRPA
jgi:hypothetical protein